uniref:Anaphase-promoting complex subunit 5 n=1 Tax=Anopheles farauti TaxID=69004 RepID=A0A182R195_9DIPT
MSKKDSENVCFWLPNQTIGRMDVLTPHKMMAVFLIQEYLRLKKPVTDGATREQPPPQPVELSAGDRKRFCMLLLNLIQYPDLAYKDLYGLLVSPVYGLHPVHLEEFNKLMNLLKTVGIDVLFDLYNEIDKLIMDNSASFQIGIVGLYLRKVFVTMDRMSFHEMKDLYLATIAYYEKGLEAMQLEPSADASYNCDSFMLAQNKYIPIEPSDHGHLAAKWSVKQSELFIAQQSALLRDNEVKALPPRDLQRRLNEIIRDRPHCSQAYFLSYLNYVRVRDFNCALNALHRAFDRTPSGNTASSVTAPATNENKEYQYASLNLAILHAEFGHKKQALKCLRECITLAQEYGDANCLQLAHCWQAHLEDRLIPLPSARTTSSNLFHATSLRMLSFMRRTGVNDDPPASLFATLTGIDLAAGQRSMMDLIATSVAQRVALWTVYGRYEQASMCAQILLNVNLKSLDLTYNGNGICQMLCTVTVRLAYMGEFNHALVVLQQTAARFPRYPGSHDWQLTKHYLTALRAIYRGRFEEACQASQNLHAYDANLSLLQLAHVAIARQDHVTGKVLLEGLLRVPNLEPLTAVRAMILQANIYLETHNDQAIIVLNQAQVLARTHHLQYENALIDLHFGQLLLERMRQPQQAFISVKSGLETVLANGPIYDQARAHFLFARTIIAAERASNPPNAKVLQLVRQLAPLLERAVEMFEKLECYVKAKDVWLFLARTYHELEAEDERNHYAYQYQVLDEQFHTPRQYSKVFL